MSGIPRRARVRQEAGETLLEILITIVILAIGVLGVSSMITNSVSAADRLRGRAEIGQVVTRVADAVQRAGWECNIATPTNTFKVSTLDALRPNANWTIAVTNLSHWGPTRAFEAGCPTLLDADGLPTSDVFKTLNMTIVVTGPGTRGTQKFGLVKRP
jgi:type II secretory pathway pseudopilin PulG